MRKLARPLLYLGVLGVVLGLSKLHAAYVADPPYDFTGSSRFGWALTYAGLLGLAAYGVGLPDLPRTARGSLGSAVAAAGGAALGISLLQLIVGDALLPRFVVFGSALVLVPWYPLCTAVARGGEVRAGDRDQVVVVGRPGEVDAVRAELAAWSERPAQLAGSLTCDEAAACAANGRDRLVELVHERSATVVVLDRDAQADEAVVAQAAVLHEQGMRIRTLTLFYDEWLGKLPLSELERVSLPFDIGELHRTRYGRVKRLIDVTISGLGLLPLLLALPFVAIGNLVANRGPLLNRQERVGKQGEVFNILKFRTMRPADGDLPNDWTAEDDPRITPFGRLLRTTHLDELPQVVNILRGDLAVVGPGPSSPTTSPSSPPSCPSTTCATSSGRGSPGRRR